ncbi:four helix bundle protein [Bryocella elongata]|uniref:Four helix bundle protein n=1 Tax=Bryocella elongata TaxID=863522 RepID=A0A1H6BMJ3_9BACT|nr:four helix bundle protein [Bryocella elongata]SEG61928.1 four helix bundle protein [Bryocella elongata]
MRDFRSLDVWRKSHALTLQIHRLTEAFPKAESAGLGGTMRRWSANMTMKIAEACGRDTPFDYVASLRQSRGFATELEYQLLLARDLTFLVEGSYDPIQNDLVEVRKMLTGLIRSQAV